MTLIIGQEEARRVTMAADSAVGRPEEFYALRHLAKIAPYGPYMLGSCGSLRIGQILHHCVEWPEPPDSGDLLPFLVRELMPEIRRAVQDAGAEHTDCLLGEKTIGLVGVRGELFVFGSDLAVVRPNGLACIGCGRHAAYPVMEALQLAGVEPARKRIEMTLEIVARHVPVVEPPFLFLESCADQGVAPRVEGRRRA